MQKQRQTFCLQKKTIRNKELLSKRKKKTCREFQHKAEKKRLDTQY